MTYLVHLADAIYLILDYSWLSGDPEGFIFVYVSHVGSWHVWPGFNFHCFSYLCWSKQCCQPNNWGHTFSFLLSGVPLTKTLSFWLYPWFSGCSDGMFSSELPLVPWGQSVFLPCCLHEIYYFLCHNLDNDCCHWSLQHLLCGAGASQSSNWLTGY